MDLYQRKRDLFFRNLLLLGFDVATMENKYQIVFTKDMFLVPNKKGFEVVTQFLFAQLNNLYPGQYVVIWPLMDKSLEREFRKACYSHFMKIIKDDSVSVRFPRIYQTTFLSPGGERFYELYLALSTYVLLKVIQKDKVCEPLRRPSHIAHNHKEVKENLQVATITAANEFLKVQKSSLDFEQKCQKFAKCLIGDYRMLKQTVVKMHDHIKERAKAAIASCPDIASSDASHEQKIQALHEKSVAMFLEVMYIKQSIEVHLSQDEKLWSIIRTELNSECVERDVLDGQKYIIPIPEALKARCKEKFVNKGVQSLTENGKLSFASFLDTCYICVEHYKEELERVGFPRFEMQEAVEQNIQKLEQNLRFLKSSRQTMLVEVLPKLRSAVEKLENKVHSKSLNFSGTVPITHLTPALTFTVGHIPHISPGESFVLTPPTGPIKMSFRQKSHGTMNSLVMDLFKKTPRQSVENRGHLTPYYSHLTSTACKSSYQKRNRNMLKDLCINDIMSFNPGRDVNVRSCIERVDADNRAAENEMNPSEITEFYNSSKNFPPLSTKNLHCRKQVDYLDDSLLLNSEFSMSGIEEINASISSDTVEGAEEITESSKEVCSEKVTEENDTKSKFPNWLDDSELLDNETLPAIPQF